MSKTQDVFGAAPKSVLNKPFLHLQEKQPAGSTSDATLANAEAQRKINTVVTDEIGTTLLNNTFTLPAGTYYCKVKAGVGSGVRYNRVSLKDSADNIILLGMTAGVNAGTNDQTDARCEGQFDLAQSTTLKLMHFTNNATGVFGITMTNDPNEEIWLDVQVWKLDSNVETPVISDPTLTLARPLMHCQYTQQATYTMVAAIRTALLDSVLTNEIPGASLAANEISLPAGTYYIEGFGLARTTEVNCATITVKKSDDTVLLNGDATGSPEQNVRVAGRIILTETTSIKLVVQQLHTTGTISLGNLATPSVVNELRIWQLDAVNKQPVLVNDKLFPLPGNVIVTGNMHGLEYEYTAPNQITVQAGICMDSVNETVLTLTNPQLVTIPSGVDTVYNLFLTDDGQLVKTDTDVDGANLPAQDKRRWIGYVITGGAGTILDFVMIDDTLWHTVDFTLVTPAATFAPGLYMPLSRVKDFSMITSSTNAHRDVEVKMDNSAGHTVAACSSGSTAGTPATLEKIPAYPLYYWETGSTCNGDLKAVTMKR